MSASDSDPSISLSPDLETGYLLACLAHGLDESRPWPHPPRGLDWKRLLALLDRHRLTGFFHALGRSDSESWPEDFHEQLRLERYRWMVHGEQSRSRVHSVLGALTSAGVDVIVLKGWAHISSIYGGDASQRLCEDVDLLVHPRDAETAGKILRSLGCLHQPPAWPGYAQRYNNGEVYFFAPLNSLKRDAFSVGLHWGLLHVPSYDPSRVDVDALFARARAIDVAGLAVKELAVEDAIVYASAHLFLHHYLNPALFRYYEMAVSICSAGASLDWDKLIRTASGWDAIIPLQQAVRQIEACWPELIPPAALKNIEQLTPDRRERFISAWLKWTRGRPTFDHLLVWLTFPDWKQRPLIFLQDVFPGPEYLRWRYGAAPFGFWPLLYLRRLSRSLVLLAGGGERGA